MKSLSAALLICAICCLLLTETVSFLDQDDPMEDEYGESNLERLMENAIQKRSCIRRGGSCDHRPGDCCHSSSCRCNLWGSNCRCQRMGLFQKWGK